MSEEKVDMARIESEPDGHTSPLLFGPVNTPVTGDKVQWRNNRAHHVLG